jgi:hypothetical protein
MWEPFHILKKTLTEMYFFLDATVFREGKHSPTVKRDLCCHGNIRNKTCEARDRTFSIRYRELLITKKENGRYCLTCLIGWKDTVYEGQTGRVVEENEREIKRKRKSRYAVKRLFRSMNFTRGK